MVVALTTRAAEDRGNEGETREALCCEFFGFADLGGGEGSAGGCEGLVFVGVETDGLLFVGFVDVVLGGGVVGFEADEFWGGVS